MIEINLLPEDMRRKERQLPFELNFDIGLELGKIKFLAAGIFAGVLVLLLLVFFMGSFVRSKQIIALKVKEEAIASQKGEAEKVNNEFSILKAKVSELDAITRRSFLWSEKLNQLSDLVLPGIWFTRIYTDSEDRFIIEGSVISKQEEAMASVGKFMKNIREDTLFFKDFSNIKLESVQRKTIDERDIVDFRIVLYFAEDIYGS